MCPAGCSHDPQPDPIIVSRVNGNGYPPIKVSSGSEMTLLHMTLVIPASVCKTLYIRNFKTNLVRPTENPRSGQAAQYAGGHTSYKRCIESGSTL